MTVRRDVTTDWLKGLIENKNADPLVDGILLQYPLPSIFEAPPQHFESLIGPEKNVDAIFKFDSDWTGLAEDYLTSDLTMRSIPAIVLNEIILRHNIKIKGSKVVIVGKDQVNYPAVDQYLKMNYLGDCELKLVEGIRSRVDMNHLKEADVVISCRNEPHSVHIDNLKSDSFAIDFGYGTTKGGITGDFAFDEDLEDNKFWVSRVPGGTGSLVAPALARNLYVSWKRKILQKHLVL